MMNRFVASVLIVCTIVLSACGPSGQSQAPVDRSQTSAESGQSARPTAKKRVVVGAREAASVLSGKIDTEADVSEEMISAGLTGLTPVGDAYPILAEAVPTLENGNWKVFPDGRMETTWTMRPNLTWHDGTAITTEDLLFAVRVGQDRELPDFGHAGFAAVANVRAVDARTITVEWKEPFIQADKMFNWAFALPLPRHLLEEAYTTNKAAFPQHRYWTHEFVHAGAFKVKEFIPTERMSLEAFDGYALGRPIVDEVEVRYISDANTLGANLIAGEVHFTIGPGLTIEQALQIQGNWSGGKVGTGELQSNTVLYPQFVDPNPSLIADVRFRRALQHGLDRNALNDLATRGYAPISGFIVPPGAPEFPQIQPSIVEYPYDPRRSAQLLEEMGLTRVGETYRDASGQEIPLQVEVSTGDTAQESATLFVADSWTRLGFRGVPLPASPQVRDRRTRSTRPAFEVTSFSAALSEPARLTRFTSRDIPSAQNNFRGSNYMRYANPQLDTLVDKFFVTIPRPEQVEVLKQIAAHVTDQLVLMPLYHTVHASLISNRVQNVTPRTGHSQTYQAHRWDIN
jgi:peptide/nickel transport system substrate-binding protein